MKKLLILNLAVLSLITSGCSSSDDSTAATPTAGVLALQSLQSKMASLDSMLPGGATTSSLSADRISQRTALGANWTSVTMPNPTADGSCSVSDVSLKDWMGYEFEADAVRCNGSSINVFGRVESATMILCAILQSQSAATSSALPTSGSSTITFDAGFVSTLQSVCGMSSTDAAMVSGQSGTLTYEVPGDTSTFDRKITISIASGMIENEVYLKFDSSGGGAMAFNESNDNGSSRTVLTYNATTKLMLAEYISRGADSPNPVYVHRLYKDETNSNARVYSRITDTTNTIEYVLSGYPGSSDLAFAVGVTGYGFGSPIAGEACVNPETGDIVTDNTTTCGTFSSVAVTAATGAESVAGTVNGAPTTWNSFATPPALSWSTTANMLTSGL